MLYWIKIILTLTLIIVVAFVFNHSKKSKEPSKIMVLETREFACDGVAGFKFKYPVFDGWGVRGIVSEKESQCTMFFDWPESVEYEKPPQIKIEKSNDLTLKSAGSSAYKFVQDPSLYTEGHVFKEGDWDFLVFYGESFGVKISRANFGQNGFDQNLFYKTIVETFAFEA